MPDGDAFFPEGVYHLQQELSVDRRVCNCNANGSALSDSLNAEGVM